MKRSELKEFIKGEIVTSLSEASPEEVQNQKELNKELEITAKLSKDLGLEEANIGLADLEEIGYTDGDKAVAMHFNHDVVGINNDVDFQAYRKGFIQGVNDATIGFSLNEEAGDDDDDDVVKYKGEDHVITRRDGDRIYLRRKEDAVVLGKMPEFWVKSQDINENEDDDLDAKAIKQAKGARGKHKKLDLAVKALRDITTEMKSLARDYSKADGVEKEKIKDQLKSKTPKKKELESLVAKLEKDVI
ncbi:hypothetical protein N9Q43_00775 [bacterium]|nr:hypothetical protein [bacterium]